MKQFYETYKDDEKVSTVLTQLSWSNHLKLLSACKSNEERLFYMQLCIKEGYSARELSRQVDSGYYERYMLSKTNLSPAISQAHNDTGNIFLDNYVLEFLDLPEKISEKDLQKTLLDNLKKFIFEIGKDFTLKGTSKNSLNISCHPGGLQCGRVRMTFFIFRNKTPPILFMCICVIMFTYYLT